ncbi:hypothetical protein QMQ04_29620, partial [Escherichia coli]|nr:hypothetical protein [Escherichia coli]
CQDAVSHQGNAAIIIPFPDHNFKPGLRRARSQAATVCTIADMTVDMVRRTVIRSGKKIHLTGNEYVLLELLLQRTGEVLPRSLISS